MATRYYQWEAVIWKESAPDNLIDIITDDFGVKGFLSPLHISKNEKFHYHWLLCYDTAKSYQQVLQDLHNAGLAKDPYDEDDDGVYCINTVQYVKDLTTRARYLCHLDSSRKEHYSPEDVICIGGTTYDKFLEYTVDKINDDLSIIELIDRYRVRSYAQLVRYCLYCNRQLYRSVVGRCGFWSAYVRSLSMDSLSSELENIIDERKSKKDDSSKT